MRILTARLAGKMAPAPFEKSLIAEAIHSLACAGKQSCGIQSQLFSFGCTGLCPIEHPLDF
jgi:hypothetical protein